MSARPANPELRDNILKAAAEIIEGCGPDCVTMREVAEKVGYSSTTLYLYFKDKGAILRESVLLGFDEFNDSCAAAMVGPRAIDKFRQYCRAYVMWGVMHPGHYTLMFELPWDMEWSVQLMPEHLGRLTRGRTMVLDLLAQAIAAGELPELVDVEAFNTAGWAALHGATSLAISRRLTVGIENPSLLQVVDAATGTADTLVNALISAAGAQAR